MTAGVAVATAALGLVAGSSLGAPADHRVRAAASSVTVECAAQSFVVDVDPAGRARLLEYDLGKPMPHPSHPRPTGRVLAYVDAATRTVHPACKVTRSLQVRKDVLVGPYARSVRSKVFCGDIEGPRAHRVRIQVRPVVNHAKRRIGNRLIATLDSLTVVNASITARGGGISFDPFRCSRNNPFIP
jgi:hypothetical protein